MENPHINPDPLDLRSTIPSDHLDSSKYVKVEQWKSPKVIPDGDCPETYLWAWFENPDIPRHLKTLVLRKGILQAVDSQIRDKCPSRMSKSGMLGSLLQATTHQMGDAMAVNPEEARKIMVRAASANAAKSVEGAKAAFEDMKSLAEQAKS
jgi:hypothetical protein